MGKMKTGSAQATPLRAAIYARVSTPKQASIPQQIMICRDRCENLGFRVRYILKEDGWSAKNTDRPMLLHLLQLCADAKVDVIVVWKLDRLVRSLTDLMNTHRLLESWRVRLHSVTEQFDTESPFGRFSFRNIASAAELERELIAERARMGKLSQARRGVWPTQRPPLGYALGNSRRLVIEQHEADLVRQIFADYCAGHPLTEISRSLGTRGMTTRMGRTFSPAAVLGIVRNELYTGKLVLLGVAHERPDLRIIEDAEWHAALGRRGRRMSSPSPDRRTAALDAVVGDYFAFLDERESNGEVIEAPDWHFVR